MRKAVLFYNPLSGSRRERRLVDVESGMAVLRGAGVDVSAAPTRAAADASGQVRQAIADGCDTVFACGGDGTVHDVLQGLVGSQTALGIIPLGTANALAHDLALPRRPADAARAALGGETRRVAVGRVEYQDLAGETQARFFTVALGIGVDAHLFYKLDPLAKRSFGMLSYYAKATHLWLAHRLENFAVELVSQEGGKARCQDVSQLLAVRIRNFGGVLQELAPGSGLERNDLRLVLFHTQRRWAYLHYVTRCLLRSPGSVKGVELTNASQIQCQAPGHARIFVEADGELLGTLPAEISVVPDALTLLIPRRL